MKMFHKHSKQPDVVEAEQGIVQDLYQFIVEQKVRESLQPDGEESEVPGIRERMVSQRNRAPAQTEEMKNARKDHAIMINNLKPQVMFELFLSILKQMETEDFQFD